MKMLITSLCLLALFTFTFGKNAGTCDGVAQYSQCSANKECGCLQRSESTDDSGICGLLTLQCSTMSPCSSNGKTCSNRNHVCIRHPTCDFRPLCYPINKATYETCPPMNTPITTTSSPQPFHPSCDWTRDSVIVSNQLKGPTGLFIVEDDDISIYVADSGNHRIIKLTPNDSMNSPVVISINGTNQLSYPRDILISKKDGSIFICDKGNERIVRWNKDATKGETLLTKIQCESLIMDKSGSLIVSELNKDRVTKWQGIDESHSSEKVIAGGHGKGSDLNQLNHPRDILIDEQDQSIYISDSDNHRIIKWNQGSQEGIIVAGRNGRGNKHDQLAHPRGIALHSNGDLYIADTSNQRIIKWKQGEQTGTIIVDGHIFGRGQHSPQPFGLTFDQHYRNLYVTDWANSRLVRFSIDEMGNCATLT